MALDNQSINNYDKQINDVNMQKKIEAEEYQQIINKIKPKPPLIKNIFMAFIVGGLICTLGQLITNYFLSLGLEKLDAGSATSAVLVFLAALLTGLGIYDSIGKYAGAGSIVPITGFANSMVAPALEFKKEGYILGVGSKLFTIAGPVLVFGIVISWIIGIIYFFFLR